MNRILLAISLLAVVGMALSAVSLKNHYSGEKTEYCDLSENFNCDLVNRIPTEASSVIRRVTATLLLARQTPIATQVWW